VRTADLTAALDPAAERRSRLVVASPLGELELVADDEALATLILPPRDTGMPDETPQDPRAGRLDDVPGHVVLSRARTELQSYFRGDLQSFTVPLRPLGTTFQLAVWNAVLAIPYGATTTYGEIAGRLGPEVSPRAVGRAVGQNPLAIVIPCHRVVGSDGSLTGYGGGLHRKRYVLDLERGVRPVF